MNVPESLPQVLIFIAMLVPGISFVTVRTWFVGWRSPDYGAGSRILESLYVSAIFVIIYVGLGLAIFGLASELTGMVDLGSFENWVTNGWRNTPAWWIGLVSVVLLVGVPGGVAALMSWSRIATEVDADGNVTYKRRRVNRNQTVPRAWDMAAYGADTPRFVRVKTATGIYVGGWYDIEGYISTYPYERDMFIAHQWRMGKRGQFLEPIEDSLGVWVPINDDCHVEWIAAPPTTPRAIRSRSTHAE
ncbi:hypothetical protein GY21_08500 [Cryobacterium roopkundense]|uniref:Uncharacterized protein n=1 Tax=Cryobacterium roopkundense TaxID=1001240 RepID=A0A099JHI2_9MICO|nr:DUF6338 family protein [Cryobacterium roopkundense]KGJ76953.1 hypothetical protein GY21_08500 [Cryobacterium roopkundense]MBB5640501.1 hypothetical protein [Cryobacterium roopkundense]